MASFASTPNISFTPYISTVPVETYGAVGMYKQNQYDTNIQRINSALDKYAGFELYRPQDKQYLEQQLGNTTAKLNQLAGGDYSSQSMLNNALGIAHQLSKDNRIQSALSSTVQIKDGYAQMKAAQKEGKSNIANEYDFNQKVSSYVKSTSPDEVFKGTYTPYVDVRKKALDIITKLKPDVNITESDISVGNLGEINLSVTAKRKMAGVSPGQIRQALEFGLDANDLNQLSIEGRYTYRGATPETLAKDVDKIFTSSIAEIDANIKRLEAQKVASGRGDEKMLLQRQIDEYTEDKENIVRNSVRFADMVAGGNLEEAKGFLYNNQFKAGISKGFSYTERSEEYEDSPYTKVQLEKAKLAAKASPTNILSPQGVAQPTTGEQTAQATVGNYEAAIQTTKGEIDGMVNNFLSTQNRQGDRVWYNEQRKKYSENPSSVSPSVKDFFRNLTEKEKVMNSGVQILDKLKTEADAQFGRVEDNIPLPKNAEPLRFQYQGQVYDYSPREVAAFAAKYNSLLKGKLREPVSGLVAGVRGMLGGEGRTNFEREWESELSNKEKLLLSIYNKTNSAGSTRIFDDAPAISETDRSIASTLKDYLRVSGDLLSNKTFQEKQNWIGEQLKARTGYSRLNDFALDVGTKEKEGEFDRDKVKADINSIINAMKPDGDDAFIDAQGTKVDKEELLSLVSDEGAAFSIGVQEGGALEPNRYRVTVSGNVGNKGKSSTFYVTEDQKRALVGDRFSAPAASNHIKNRLTLTGNGSTNFEGTADPIRMAVNPFFTRNDFPKVNSMNIKGADLLNMNGTYYLKICVTNPLTNKDEIIEYAPDSRTLNPENVSVAIASITDESLYKAVTGKTKE